MTPVIAQRLDGVSESATLKLNALVQTLKAQGRDVVNLTAGETDFKVPQSAKDAAIEAVRTDQSKYTPVAGIPQLRELILKKTHEQQPTVAAQAPWKMTEVLVSCGAKQAIFNFILATTNPGDKVLIPAPYWLSYPEIVKIAGGIPEIIPTTIESGFKLQPDQLKQALKKGAGKIKTLILNSPSNPTGAMYSKAELAALGKVLLETPEAAHVWVVSDEIYDLITFGEMEFCSFLEATPGLRNRCVTVNGLSKSAAMTGWRVGWSVAPLEVTQAMATLQGQSSSGICALAQWAGVAALKLPVEHFKQQAAVLRKKRDLALDILQKSVKMKVRVPEGAFYAFIGIEGCLKPGEDSFGFAERLLQEAGVAVVPGTPFGGPEFVRMSFATDEVSLKAGCERFLEFVQKSE